ncbi:hypothetical protein DTO013E5_986 [Penicillium roqueforti]|uniref:DUF3533 domain-containing protein n=1 Tax=Penicillium roqueforti (strain FM164) TaxID=1365484 RepID=W6PXQ4_PENRF|nr:hypothetical protein CBS147318_2060 [Penicillium roqueforti]CDM28566.1 Domain of unknown function DUF3533 [Penicillium roqueforti FM164]KAI2747717.1 hypothetical protein DTO012A1_363 [Penicillium roqueforti]KAI2751524.1 hypothetical protein DTO013F2_3861 [Penicillium roqueforti]KAI2772668.1 hypothetical protein DTO012A8_2708 [Penicillium roqueforti]
MGAWKEIRPRFLPAVITMFLLLQVLFLVNMCYLYATQFRSTTLYHNFNVLYVDYDGGIIGKSVSDAYNQLQGDGFPTLLPRSSNEYPQPEDIREAVCRGEYWAAIYTTSDGSASLESALANGSNPLTSLTYIWNGVRYPVFSQAAVYTNILKLIATTRSTYYANAGSSIVASADFSNEATLKAFLDPIHAAEINIKGTQQGTRVFYNTVSMVIPIVQQFFFILALNGISTHLDAFINLSWKTNVLIRAIASTIYALTGSLLMAGYIWAFRESWGQQGSRFVLTWVIMWLLMHINFLFFDIATAFIPIQFMPFVVLTWAILNVASTISPFELSPGFFRWGYALPSYEAYQVLVQIWSDGCDNRLYRALPIMFSWWIVGVPVAVYAMRYRCRTAVAAREVLDRAGLECQSEGKHAVTNETVLPISSSGREFEHRADSIEPVVPLLHIA